MEEQKSAHVKYPVISLTHDVYRDLNDLKKETNSKSINKLLRTLMTEHTELINTVREKDFLFRILDVLIRRDGWIFEDSWVPYAGLEWHDFGFLSIWRSREDNTVFWKLNERIYWHKDLIKAGDWFRKTMAYRVISDLDMVKINEYLDINLSV